MVAREIGAEDVEANDSPVIEDSKEKEEDSDYDVDKEADDGLDDSDVEILEVVSDFFLLLFCGRIFFVEEGCRFDKLSEWFYDGVFFCGIWGNSFASFFCR